MARTTHRAATEPARELTIAVISDLHAFDSVGADEKTEPSHLCTNASPGVHSQHPTRALEAMIVSESLAANLLLCPGDLGDKARPAAISYAWSEVNRIATRMHASEVVATVGNHDIDSRFNYSDHDPKGFLQTLTPPFPLRVEPANDRFWSRNYAVLERTDYRLLVLNSSAFHGGKPDEINHGRISERTLDAIKRDLSDSETNQLTILLCHHHPHKHSEFKLGEYDEMLGGQLLLTALGSGEYGEWFILHGHKHHPKICYAARGSNAPVIFSAGSLCAKLYPELGIVARNQFYMIRFPVTEFGTMGLVGTFEAWDWITGKGWQRAGRTGSGLPGRGGFGFRSNIDLLANEVSKAVNGETMEWETLLASMSKLRYLIPADLEILITRLKTQHGIRVLTSPEGDLEQIGMAP